MSNRGGANPTSIFLFFAVLLRGGANVPAGDSHSDVQDASKRTAQSTSATVPTEQCHLQSI